MKTLKAMLATLVTLFPLANISQAASVWVDGDLTNKYLGFDSGGMFYDGPVYQTSINMEFENGFGVGLWGSTSFDTEWGDNFGDEIDFIVWLNKSIGGFDINASLFYFWEPIADFADVVYPRLKVSREFGDWTIGIQAGCYIMVDGSEGGWLFGPYASRNFEINDKLSVPLTLKVIRDDGGFGLSDGYIGQVHTGLVWKATEDLSLRIYGTLYIPMGVSPKDPRSNEGSVGVGFTKNF